MSRNTISLIDDNRSPWQTILLLAWPIFVEQVLSSLVHTVDTAMVGSLGKIATASVAISSSPNMLINGAIMSLGVGFTSMIARSVGAGDPERARGLLRQAILTVLSLSIPVAIVCFALARQIPIWMGGEPEILDFAETYNKILVVSLPFRCMTMILTSIFRGYGDSKTPMKINIMVNLSNVVGNYFMIFPTRQLELFGAEFTMPGLGWGVAGAAASTSLTAIIGSLTLLSVCFTRPGEMQISLRDDFRPNWPELRTVIRLGLPAMGQRIVMNSAAIIVTSTVASLGTAALAAQNLTGTAESLSFMPGFAFSAACTTLYGQSLGAKRPDLAHDFLKRTVTMCSVVMACTTVGLFVGAEVILGLLTPDPEVIELGSVLLRIVALIQVPQGIAFCISGGLQGGGDTRSPLIVSMASVWGVRILGILLCVHLFHLGLYAVCVCMCTDNVVRCILFLLRYRQQRHKLAKIEL